MKASGQDGQPGVYHLIIDVTLDGKGNRFERVKAADSTLQCIAITKEDLDSFRNQSLLVPKRRRLDLVDGENRKQRLMTTKRFLIQAAHRRCR